MRSSWRWISCAWPDAAAVSAASAVAVDAGAAVPLLAPVLLRLLLPPALLPAPVVQPVQGQRLYDVLHGWPTGNIDLRIGDYMMRPHQKWTITPVLNAGGYPGSPYFKIQIADTDRTLAAAEDNEVVTVPTFTGAPEQLWRIDQLTDGTYRIMPKAVPNSTEPVALIAVGASTPTLAKFDPKSDKGRWTFRKP